MNKLHVGKLNWRKIFSRHNIPIYSISIQEIESERVQAAETEAINQVEAAETEAIDNQAEDLYDHLYDDHTQSKETFGHAVDTEQIHEV